MVLAPEPIATERSPFVCVLFSPSYLVLLASLPEPGKPSNVLGAVLPMQ